MKNYLPFTDYDFWAYISSGFVFLFALDHTLQTAIFHQRSTWTIVEGLIAVAVAYVVGHLLAGLASSVLERRFVGKYLGRPSVLLLGAAGERYWPSTRFWCLVNECRLQAIHFFSQIKSRRRGKYGKFTAPPPRRAGTTCRSRDQPALSSAASILTPDRSIPV
jgi:hypothetical protein